MKKVLIATWYLGNNFGTVLQAYSLKKFLEKENFEVFMQYPFGEETHVYHDFIATFMNKLMYRLNTKKSGKGKSDNSHKAEIEQQKEKFEQFFTDVYKGKHLSIATEEDTKKVKEQIDIFISGGDQIWNPYFLNRHMMFDYVDNDKKVISFGTSVGVKKIPFYYKKFYRIMLSKYRFIGVREESSRRVLERLTKNNVSKVVDPTLLIRIDEWNEDIKKYSQINLDNLEKDYILCYFVGDRDYWDYVKAMQLKTGYKVYILPITQSMQEYRDDYEYIIDTSPLDFLNLIKNAKIVCTDSYHATVFSTRFMKETYVLKRFSNKSKKSQNGRLYEYLKTIGKLDIIVDEEKVFQRNEKNTIDSIEGHLESTTNQSKELLLKELREDYE
ncbi:MAG: polysaccharide pyruvyl transferase family protein [Eubacterium sp.]|nr:polysaccharide pyruvyl transferase family protein [Eubacterium sp.]